jgi:hypothetical protein
MTVIVVNNPKGDFEALGIQVNWVRSIIVIDGVVSVNQGLFLIHPLEKLILGINH